MCGGGSTKQHQQAVGNAASAADDAQAAAKETDPVKKQADLDAEQRYSEAAAYHAKKPERGSGFGSTLETIGMDAALAMIPGGAAFIPLANAGISYANTGSFRDAAFAGGEAFAGQEILGAVGNAFPETAASIGMDTSGNSLSDLIGTSSGAGSFAGPGTIGGAVSKGFNSAIGAVGGGATDTSINGMQSFDINGNMVNQAGSTLNPSTGDVVAPPSTPTSTGATGFGVTDANNAQINSMIQDTGNIGSDITGTQTAGATQMGSVAGGAAGDSSLAAAGGNASAPSIGPGPVGGDVPLSTGAANAINAPATDAIGSQSNNLFAQSSGIAPTPSFTPPSTDFSGSAPPDGAGSGGWKDWLPSKGDVGKLALNAALPVGALAYDALKGPAALPTQSAALDVGGAATAPLLGLEKQGATEAMTGQLTAPQQANIMQYVQDAQNQLLQQLASSGSTDPSHDSRYIQGMEDIRQKALAFQQQYITAAISEATSAGGAASGNITAVANQQIAQDTNFQNALNAAFAGLGGSIGGVNVNQKQAA